MYLAMAKQRGIGWDTLGGTLQNDILKEFHSQNEFIYPPEASVKLVVDTIEFQAQHVPKWNSVSISGYHIREAGSTADAGARVHTARRHGVRRGVPASAAWTSTLSPRRLSFFFNSHNEFFEEICKLRAARRIWARMMRERYGAKHERSWFMKTHVQTAGCSLTEQQPLNNVVRVAYQAMAAVLGGCQSLHTDSMDETLGLPTEKAVTVALRTQQILAHETGVTRTVDPLGGSWFVEALTDEIEREALDLIEEIDALGGGAHPQGRAGVVAGIHKGYFRRKIAEAAYRYAEECEAGDRLVVGVNAYQDDADHQVEVLRISDEVERTQAARLAEFKGRRDGAKVEEALEAIRQAARDDANTMPSLIEGSDAGCTLGEMVQALADVFGRYASGPEW